MALELVRDALRFSQVIGEGQSQAVVEKDIIVPDMKPDIARVLSLEGKINIVGREIEQDRVSLDGKVDFLILYGADGEPQSVYSINQEADFANKIGIAGALSNMEPEVECRIEHIDYDLFNGRKLHIRCLINMSVRIINDASVDAVKEVSGEGDIQLLRDTLSVDESAGDGAAQAVIRGSIMIPGDMPPVGDILKCSAIVHKKESSIDEGRVIISGSVLLPVLYASKSDEIEICRAEQDMPFTHTIEIPGVTSDMRCKATYAVEDVYVNPKENDDGEATEIEAEIVLVLGAKVTARSEASVIVDAYGIRSQLSSQTESIDANLFFGEGSGRIDVNESLAVPEGEAGIEKVYDVGCRPSITECKTVDDKVAIEGIIVCDATYLGRGEEKKAYGFSEEVPFKTEVTVPGCDESMHPEVVIDIESIDFSSAAKSEIEIRVSLSCLVRVYHTVKKDFITSIAQGEGELPLHKASITIYVVQPKDTLWKIAKRYYTTVNDIINVNGITDPDNIMPGAKLIIPKRL